MRRSFVPLLCLALAPLTSQAQDDMSKVEVKVVPVAGSVSMLVGQGGNIGVSAGGDGGILVDDEFAPLLPKIRAAVKTLSDKPIRFLVNTHHHFDHTGGNQGLGESGTIIIAHDNVRKRLSVESVNKTFNVRTAAQPPAALPLVTFADGVTLHANGDDIEVVHVANAHTDGDSILRWKTANVVHLGDTYFNGMYPFIDVEGGGSLDGTIAAADKILPTLDDATKIIPGHGPLSNKAEYKKYRDMLVGVRDRLRALAAQGKTLDQVIAARPTAAYDAAWGNGVLKPDQFVGTVYASVSAAKPGTGKK
jgi:glyoxylase-like metal-dependent hydrolase (beta-lactamase superfamily II)